MLWPVNSSHALLKKVQSLSSPAVQIMIGAASAIVSKRLSLSVKENSARRRLKRLSNKPVISSACRMQIETPPIIHIR